jgi:hypothetical protein
MMKKYKVCLVRGYVVDLFAKNEKEAKKIAEFYIGGENDLSTKSEREKYSFEIEEIEMTTNDAIDARPYEE